METLSVVIIAKNEEENIRECLERVSWADEIVVLDSGSTDRTESICREFGSRFEYREWDGYTKQRNAAHDLATCDWILSLDADERISPELAEEIKAVLQNGPKDVDGYNLPYKVFFRGKWLKHGGFFPETHLRLFRRGKGAYGDRVVHEALRVQGPVGALTGFVEHYSWRDVSDFILRMENYSTLSAAEYHRAGRRIGPIRIAGRTAWNFFNMYVLRLGFLDGYEGFLMAGLYSFYTFAKYAKLKELTDG